MLPIGRVANTEEQKTVLLSVEGFRCVCPEPVLANDRCSQGKTALLGMNEASRFLRTEDVKRKDRTVLDLRNHACISFGVCVCGVFT
jgi:hypothetical protein